MYHLHHDLPTLKAPPPEEVAEEAAAGAGPDLPPDPPAAAEVAAAELDAAAAAVADIEAAAAALAAAEVETGGLPPGTAAAATIMSADDGDDDEQASDGLVDELTDEGGDGVMAVGAGEAAAAPAVANTLQPCETILVDRSGPVFDAMLAHLSACRHFALDTEFTWRAVVLLQLCAPALPDRGLPKRVYVVDPLGWERMPDRIRAIQRLGALLADPDRIKILHSMSQVSVCVGFW